MYVYMCMRILICISTHTHTLYIYTYRPEVDLWETSGRPLLGVKGVGLRV